MMVSLGVFSMMLGFRLATARRYHIPDTYNLIFQASVVDNIALLPLEAEAAGLPGR